MWRESESSLVGSRWSRVDDNYESFVDDRQACLVWPSGQSSISRALCLHLCPVLRHEKCKECNGRRWGLLWLRLYDNTFIYTHSLAYPNTVQVERMGRGWTVLWTDLSLLDPQSMQTKIPRAGFIFKSSWQLLIITPHEETKQTFAVLVKVVSLRQENFLRMRP